MQTHALHTCANTDLNLASPDRIRNIDDSLQATRALSVQTLDGGRFGEACDKRRSSELSGTTAGRKHRTHGNILNELGINSTTADQTLESTDK